MKVTVEYCAQIKQAIGLASETIDVSEPCSAQDLVLRLAERHGDPLRGFLLDAAGRQRTNNLLIVGDEQIRWNAPRSLRDGETVTILPPISGGLSLRRRR